MIATEEEFLAALEASCGIYSKAAKILGMSRQAVRDRVEKNPDIKAAVEEMGEATADEAEYGLIDLIKSSNEQVKFNAIKYYLSTKGKKRGYVERTELTGADGKNLFDPATYSDEQLAAVIAAALDKSGSTGS